MPGKGRFLPTGNGNFAKGGRTRQGGVQAVPNKTSSGRAPAGSGKIRPAGATDSGTSRRMTTPTLGTQTGQQ